MAPSPTGELHLGHARTFQLAWERARAAGGQLVMRNDDLDEARSRPHFWAQGLLDLGWLGLNWDESPELGGPFAPYRQSERSSLYLRAFERLKAEGNLYLCRCTRKQLQAAMSAPHQGMEEPLYSGQCRNAGHPPDGEGAWRFRVPEGTTVEFRDGHFGVQNFLAGRDFGDFMVVRAQSGRLQASYQLACVVDDAEMGITEVVRGADLLLSTARQILLYRALGYQLPAFFHAPLVTDQDGVRLAKRSDALSLRRLRESGRTAAEIRTLPVSELLQR